MNSLFVKIADRIIFPFDIENLLQNIDSFYWKKWPANIEFGRNFYGNFPDICNDVIEKLKVIQSTLIDTDELTHKFLNHILDPTEVNITRILPGESAHVHFDAGRDTIINIGLKNSNSGITFISNESNENKFWTSPKSNFIMQDGDVYILDVKKLHSVQSLVGKQANLTRYIITYNMIRRT
jgi:hypothetical protein